MICTSCGDETGANYCSSCGTPTTPPENQKPNGIGAGGAIVLVLTVFAIVSATNSISMPQWQLHLPEWMRLTSPPTDTDRAVGTTTSMDIPGTTPVRAPSPDPYETVSETTLQLSDYRLREVRIRLGANRSPADVDSLLRSKVKGLRTGGELVILKLYAQTSDATSSDTPLVRYVAADAEHLPYGDPDFADMTEIEPGLYRTALPR